MILDDTNNPLISLGFTELEARAYALLLERFPVTGYALAKALGKPTANTYKALESLERKGAVMAEEGPHRLYRPVSPEHLLAILDQRYQRLRSRAAEDLSGPSRDSQDHRVYRLRSRDQVLARARLMLERVREIALVDAFPGAIEELEGTIRRAIERGVLVGLKAYAPTVIEGAVVALGQNAEETRDRWPGRWLNLVADGREYLMALLTGDGTDVVQAVWTECPYLAWVHQSAFSAEVILTVLDARIQDGATVSQLRAAREQLAPLQMPQAPGYRMIMRELGSRRPGEVEV